MSYHSDFSVPDTRPDADRSAAMFRNTEAPAILLIFEPNRNHALGHHAHRPMLYNFDDRFLNRAYQIVDVGANGGGDTNELVTDVLRSREAYESVSASTDHDTLIDLDPIGGSYRFVLILNRPKAPILGGHQAFSPLCRHRVIMNGYFVHPPFSPFTGALDDQAQLVFTHKTVMEIAEHQLPSGRYASNIDSRYDATIVNPAVRGLTDEPVLFYLDPESSFMGSYDDAAGTTIARPSREQQVGYRDQSRSLDMINANPESNLRSAVTTALCARREVSDRGNVSRMYNDNGLANLPHQRQANYRHAFARNMSSRGDTSQVLGYDENTVLTMAQLGRDYEVHVQRFDSDQSGMIDVMDGRLPSASNVFCSLLAEAIPSIMASAGVLRMDFRFNSMFDRERTMVDPYTFGVEYVSTIVPMDGRKAMDIAISVVREMARGIFRNLYAGKGDFRLNAAVDLTGLTFLKLHFLCDNQVYQEPYQHPTIFSGLITNQFGSGKYAQHNASQMARFVNAVTSTDSDFDDSRMVLPGDDIRNSRYDNERLDFPELDLG